MKIAVISDLHLGAGGPADQFGHSDPEFLRFLDLLEDDFEKIVLLGDIWETLTGYGFGDSEGQLKAAREHHFRIAQRFTRKKYIYVHGNHDLIAKDVDGAPEQYEIVADRVRILFSHGHRADDLAFRFRWLSELGVWLGAWICRIGYKNLYSLCCQLDAMRGGFTSGGQRCAVRRWAEKQAREQRADIIVTGHTHVPAKAEFASGLFMNSGACAEGKFSFLSLDTRAHAYRLHSAA